MSQAVSIQTVSIVVGVCSAVLLLAVAAMTLRGRSNAVRSEGPMSGIEGALRELLALRNETAVIKLDGVGPQDHFEVRLVEGQFRFEYQVVHPEQLQNETNIRSSFASAGYECMEWGDGSDGWDKYIFVELGADPAKALKRIEDLLQTCAGTSPQTTMSITLQDFVKSGVVV